MSGSELQLQLCSRTDERTFDWFRGGSMMSTLHYTHRQTERECVPFTAVMLRADSLQTFSVLRALSCTESCTESCTVGGR